MKTATKVVQLPHLNINAYEVEGRPYVSMSEIVKATRPTSKNTDALNKWLEGAQNPSVASGSQGFPQEFEGAQNFKCEVPRAQGGTSVAHMLSPQLAARFWMSELSNRSEAVVQRALKLVTLLADVALNDLCQEALGMKVTPQENLHGAIRLQADLEKKAPDIQRLKLAIYQTLLPELKLKTIHDLPKNDIHYPLFNIIKTLINESVYRRLDEGIVEGLSVVQERSPRKPGNRKATKYSCLTTEAQQALKPVINAHIVALKQIQHLPATVQDIKRVVTTLDSVYPRYK
jgi:hypothetical protein